MVINLVKLHFQTVLDRNIREIDQIISTNTESLLIYMFWLKAGCLRVDDLIGFNTIRQAYQYNARSLVTVFNGCEANRDEKFERNLLNTFNEITKSDMRQDDVFFLNKISSHRKSQIDSIKQNLWKVIRGRNYSIPKKNNIFSLKLNNIIEERKNITIRLNNISTKACSKSDQSKPDLYVKEKERKYLCKFEFLLQFNKHLNFSKNKVNLDIDRPRQ